RRHPLAIVGIGLAVAAADGLEDLGADLRLDCALAGRVAGAGRVLAELLVVLAVRVRLAGAIDRPAGALVGFLHAGLQQLAGVVVGLVVTTTDGGMDLGAGLRRLDTDARQVGDVALADGILAGLPVRALQARDA